MDKDEKLKSQEEELEQMNEDILAKERKEMIEMWNSPEEKFGIPQKMQEKDIGDTVSIEDEEEEKQVIEEDKFGDIEEVFNDPKFNEEPRLGVSVSVAQARVVENEDNGKVNYFKKAMDNIKFIFNDPNKKIEIADIDECDEEKAQEYVITAKPGQLVKKRWRVVNNSSICWPKNTELRCQAKDADVELPKIQKALRPGQKLDISVNIRISKNETDNVVKAFVFRLYSKIYGYFGVALLATVEIIPEIKKDPLENMSQMEKLEAILEGEDEVNPIMYEIANDFVEEGLGNFEQCLSALIQCKTNYGEAKELLLKLRKE